MSQTETRRVDGISKTTITFTVLYPSEFGLPADLEDVLREADEGYAVGAVTDRVTVKLPAEQVVDELIALGNDGEFFDDDED